MKLRNAVIKIKNNLIKTSNRMKLSNKNFSIISNNCWGGFVYQKFGLKYTSPTIGLFFMGEDYVKFCKKLEYYTSLELVFIPFETSKNALLLNRNEGYPVGVLDDIEIYFMHYKSEQEAKLKWEKRCARINFNNIIFKISQREGYTKKDIQDFMKLKWKNKIAFSYDIVEGAIHVPELQTWSGDEMPLLNDLVNYADIINGIEGE